MLYDVFAQMFFYTNLSIYFRFFPLLRTLISPLEFSGKLLEHTIGKRHAPLARDNH